MAEVHIRRNLELLVQKTRHGDIRRAWDHPEPPKGPLTAPHAAYITTKGQNDCAHTYGMRAEARLAASRAVQDDSGCSVIHTTRFS